MLMYGPYCLPSLVYKFPNVAPSVWTAYHDKMRLKEVVVGKVVLRRGKGERKKPTYIIQSYSHLHEELVMCTCGEKITYLLVTRFT